MDELSVLHEEVIKRVCSSLGSTKSDDSKTESEVAKYVKKLSFDKLAEFHGMISKIGKDRYLRHNPMVQYPTEMVCPPKPRTKAKSYESCLSNRKTLTPKVMGKCYCKDKNFNRKIIQSTQSDFTLKPPRGIQGRCPCKDKKKDLNTVGTVRSTETVCIPKSSGKAQGRCFCKYSTLDPSPIAKCYCKDKNFKPSAISLTDKVSTPKSFSKLQEKYCKNKNVDQKEITGCHCDNRNLKRLEIYSTEKIGKMKGKYVCKEKSSDPKLMDKCYCKDTRYKLDTIYSTEEVYIRKPPGKTQGFYKDKPLNQSVIDNRSGKNESFKTDAISRTDRISKLLEKMQGKSSSTNKTSAPIAKCYCSDKNFNAQSASKRSCKKPKYSKDLKNDKGLNKTSTVKDHEPRKCPEQHQCESKFNLLEKINSKRICKGNLSFNSLKTSTPIAKPTKDVKELERKCLCKSS